MSDLENKQVLVIGLGASGSAACRLLRERGAHVTAMDPLDIPEVRKSAMELRNAGIAIELGVAEPPRRAFDFAVVSPEIPKHFPALELLENSKIPVISELELGAQQTHCLSIGVSGTNGKTTTAELISRVLAHCGRKTQVVGSEDAPISGAVEASRDLDFLTIEASAAQLRWTKYFRPSIGVLLNIGRDHLDHFPVHADYVRAKARLFANQQAFDWAIVQSEALAQLRSLNLPVPGKVITFSANNRRADIFLERGLIISRFENWTGPLVNLEECQSSGAHDVENFMAVLALGRALRLPLEQVRETIKNFKSLPHRFETVAEINGVEYINDSKSTNLESLRNALDSISTRRGEPRVWLIAGGMDRGLDYHDLGPLISERVKGTFLIGSSREKLRAAWSLFTPCTLADSLLEAVSQAAEKAASGDVILLSPACSSFDQFQNYQHRGEMFRRAVEDLARTTNSGCAENEHHYKEDETPGKVKDSNEI